MDNNQSTLYTVYSSNIATGEGATYMVLITRINTENGKEEALNKFSKLFGSYIASNAIVCDSLYLDFPGSDSIITDFLREAFKTWEKNSENFEWYSSLHFNFA